MTQPSFRALVVEETEDHQFVRTIKTRSVSDLPKGDVLIKVHYSSLNYKDALSASGNKGVTRHFPHTPGIDAAGEVAESTSPDFTTGDLVVVTGHDLGMNTDGGFGQYVRVPAAWVVPLPKTLSTRESMMLGTAGFTATLSRIKLEEAGITPDSGDILVTGATGGVGSLAVALLARDGYKVVAATGKSDAADYLKSLGAAEIIDRKTITETPNKPLLPGRYAAAIDAVGGDILSYAIRSTQYDGVVTCCGNAASGDLNLTVYPFILRGLRLIGIDSAECPMHYHHAVWERLAGPWRLEGIAEMITEIGLTDLDDRISNMLAGKHKGRCIVRLD